MGPVIFLVQLLGYPFLNARFNTLTLWITSAGAFAVVYPLFSLLPSARMAWARWAGLMVLLAVRFSFVVVGYTSLNILVRFHPTLVFKLGQWIIPLDISPYLELTGGDQSRYRAHTQRSREWVSCSPANPQTSHLPSSPTPPPSRPNQIQHSLIQTPI